MLKEDESDTMLWCIAFLYRNTHLPSAMTYSYLMKSTLEKKTTVNVILCVDKGKYASIIT